MKLEEKEERQEEEAVELKTIPLPEKCRAYLLDIYPYDRTLDNGGQPPPPLAVWDSQTRKYSILPALERELELSRTSTDKHDRSAFVELAKRLGVFDDWERGRHD